MLSTFAGYFGTIGSDVLAIGQSVITLITDLIGAGGAGTPGGGLGGSYPPGQYPLA
ncbi:MULTISPECIES: hypothetical protein [Nocardia]|jgi:hypothetical protein|uniref:Uncharacterized protein n=2 Tax=Nocardia TaxID=1817 RepID=A0A231H650_9NOCA|nr:MULTISPECIES: hypothetical protein [Nocardia]MDR7171682.1 hypothetical protein [Nocardia kruczakiae]NKY43977.1 hypothetical protein [Nocardia cerradoensis]OXR44308.1 hypothetical protein B7C42_03869 [Nocardia cerradoensis]